MIPFHKNVRMEVFALHHRTLAKQEKMVLEAVMMSLRKNVSMEEYAPEHRIFVKQEKVALVVVMISFPKNVPMEKYARQILFHADPYPIFISI